MLSIISSEFQKIKRYHILLIGIIGLASLENGTGTTKIFFNVPSAYSLFIRYPPIRVKIKRGHID